ncbi:MAG: flavin reductase [Candidatus Aenigmarchaeota archaeon]|nr:flavin reductase [Candidatus Aenigmarchaeota archaeon]
MPEIDGPRQVILVTCRHRGKDNIITLAWHMPTSFDPRLYAISIGKTRFSHDMIRDSGNFCVNFMPAEQKKGMEHCGSVSGRNADKFEHSGFGKEECGKIDCPRIKQAIGFLECEVVDSVETGDHTVFIGKVVHSKTKGSGKRLYHITGNRYATSSD